eukprot:2546276-Prymnesium_polylepis.2
MRRMGRRHFSFLLNLPAEPVALRRCTTVPMGRSGFPAERRCSHASQSSCTSLRKAESSGSAAAVKCGRSSGSWSKHERPSLPPA